MHSYDDLRQTYLPKYITFLLIAESPPPSSTIDSSRHFYRTDKVRRNDRLFINTIKALYTDAAGATEAELERAKVVWLQRLQADGWYMIEALTKSLRHAVTKPQRQALIREGLPDLVHRVRTLVNSNTKIILIKSNVYDVAAEPLRKAGFTVLNTELVDYPGRYNQGDYRQKLARLAKVA